MNGLEEIYGIDAQCLAGIDKKRTPRSSMYTRSRSGSLQKKKRRTPAKAIDLEKYNINVSRVGVDALSNSQYSIGQDRGVEYSEVEHDAHQDRPTTSPLIGNLNGKTPKSRELGSKKRAKKHT
jgi:hypothetical protein